MKTKHHVHNLIILDESGSMESIKKQIIQGFNELVQSIKGAVEKAPNQEHFITFVSFNSNGNTVHHFNEQVQSLEQINDRNYRPDAMTPLYDAMGFSINKLKGELGEKTDYNVLVTILTDGYENASVEYSASAIKSLVEELKQERWTFTYIGTDHDVESIARSISIDNTMAFDNDDVGIKEMFLKEQVARSLYMSKIEKGQDVSDYYMIKDEPEKEDGKKG